MNLEILPTRTGGAAENMTIDFLLLQRYPRATAPRFRHYGWRAPAFTFGYAQKIAFVREQIAALGGDAHFDLCRRPTGGGLVDHREDWTYALVIPRGHPLEERPATQSYRVIHEALAEALRAQGIDARLKPFEDSPEENRALMGAATDDRVAAPIKARLEGVCFQRAEIHDVVHAATGAKIAGAAQKRNKHGLLFQGSLWRPALGAAAINWEQFETDFVAQLATALEVTAATTPWPELNEDEVSGLTEQYSSPEWIDYR